MPICQLRIKNPPLLSMEAGDTLCVGRIPAGSTLLRTPFMEGDWLVVEYETDVVVLGLVERGNDITLRLQ